MADIIMGDQGSSSGGITSWLLPLVGVGLMGLIAYILLGQTGNNQQSNAGGGYTGTTGTNPPSSVSNGNAPVPVNNGGNSATGSNANLCTLAGVGCPTVTSNTPASQGNPTQVPTPYQPVVVQGKNTGVSVSLLSPSSPQYQAVSQVLSNPAPPMSDQAILSAMAPQSNPLTPIINTVGPIGAALNSAVGSAWGDVTGAFGQLGGALGL